MGDILFIPYHLNLTSQNYARIRNETKQIINNSKGHSYREIVIDLAETNFIDSTGIGLIVSIIKRFHKKNIKIINCSAMQYEAFQVSQLDKIVEVENPNKVEGDTALIQVIQSGNVFTIQLKRDIIYENIKAFKSELVNVFGNQSNKADSWDEFVFDFQAVTYIDSAAIGTMLGIYRRVKSINKTFKVIGCSDRICQLLIQMDLREHFGLEMQSKTMD